MDKEVEIPTKRVNPLLKKISVVPAEYFQLPSRGMFYSNGELDPESEDGRVRVFPMTSIDELELKSADMLFSGDAIANVIKRRVPDVLKPMDLLANDIDYLLTCLRKVSYGEYITVKHKCTSCDDAKSHEYNIPSSELLANARAFDREKYENLSFKVAGYNVSITPITLRNLIKVIQIQAKLTSKFSTENDETTISELVDLRAASLSSIIKKVDGVDDKSMIEEWIKELHVKHVEQINKKIASLNDWGISFKYDLKCKDCDKTETITIVNNPTHLFTMPSSPEIEND